MKRFGFILYMLAITTLIEAQNAVVQSQRKNTIKLDITSNLLYRNALIVSYERITKPNQSLSITGGYQEFPANSSLGSGISVKDDRKKNGIKFGGEYRFYLKRENKFLAPRGVHLGPYFSFHNFNNTRTLEIDNNGTLEQAILDSELNIFNVGFELGYQFVLNNRWTIDLVFIGPSISHYRYKLNLGGNYTFNKDDIENEIVLDLIDRLPLLDEVINDKEAEASGGLNTWSYGYRYQVQFGYHFGRKK